MGDSKEQFRRLQDLQMADLGTARREIISTSDINEKRQVHLAAIQSQRHVDNRDAAQLEKWANLHTEVGDTQGMEELEDLNSGQSHRAHLHAMLHPGGRHVHTYVNHPVPTSSAGRGGGVVGTRGRSSFAPSPTGGRTEISLTPTRSSSDSYGGGRERGRARGQGKGRKKPQGRAHKEAPVPISSRSRRPPPSLDFAARVSEPAQFISILHSRRASGIPKPPDQIAFAPPIQDRTTSQRPTVSHKRETQVPAGSDKQTNKAVHTQSPFPRTPKSASRALPLDKTISEKGNKAQVNTAKTSPTHIERYLVETPTKAASDISSGNGSRSRRSKRKAILPIPIPANPKQFGVPVEKLPWKVLPEEEPRKPAGSSSRITKSPAKPMMPRPKVKLPTVMFSHRKDCREGESSMGREAEIKRPIRPKVLSNAPQYPVGTSPVGVESVTSPPLKKRPIPISAAAELEGLTFETTEDLKLIPSIDEVISLKSPELLDSGAQPGYKNQDIRLNARDSLQGFDEPRHLSKNVRGHELTASDVERILEEKMPAMIQHVLESLIPTEELQLSLTARRDVTPFERHRSPAVNSNSTSPPSAKKSKNRPQVPGLSPAGSEDSDIITRFEALQVSDKLAPPLQPQRATPVPSPTPMKVSKRPAAPSASVQQAAAPALRPRGDFATGLLTIHDSIYANPATPAPSNVSASSRAPISFKLPASTAVSSKAPVLLDDDVHEPRTQIMARTLSANHSNVPKSQPGRPIGVRTIGPAPYNPLLSFPNTSENQTSDLTTHAKKSLQSGPVSGLTPQPAASRIFSMPDPREIPQPIVKKPDPTRPHQPK